MGITYLFSVIQNPQLFIPAHIVISTRACFKLKPNKGTSISSKAYGV